MMKASANPFRSSEIDRIPYRFTGGSLDRLCSKLRDPHARTWCILGPEGTGKTTLMEEMAGTLPPDGEVRIRYLNEDSSPRERKNLVMEVKTCPPGNYLFLDGGEVLSRFQWYVLKKHIHKTRSRLVATVHRNPGLQVLHRTGLPWKDARELVRERAGPHFTPRLDSLAQACFMESNGNLREVFRQCYLHLSS